MASLSGARRANRPLDLLGGLVLALPVACYLADVPEHFSVTMAVLDRNTEIIIYMLARNNVLLIFGFKKRPFSYCALDSDSRHAHCSTRVVGLGFDSGHWARIQGALAIRLRFKVCSPFDSDLRCARHSRPS